MNTPESGFDDRLPEPLNAVVSRIATAEPDAEETRSVVESLKMHPPSSPILLLERPANATRRRTLLACGSVAVALALMFTVVRLPTANAMELLAESLASRPCIKMTTVADEEKHESWIMPDIGQSATRSDDWIEFFDSRAETAVTYNQKTGELVRSVRHQSAFGYVSELVTAIIACGKGSPTESVHGMKVIASESTVDGGKTVLRLALDPDPLRNAPAGATASAKITIDPLTELPSDCVLTYSADGKVRTVITEWTYPENGPANIFALGVDPSTKLVDRVPSTEVKPILAGVYSGRVNFDDYIAVTIKNSQQEVSYYSPTDISLVAKRGDKLLFARLAGASDELRGKTRAEAADLMLSAPGDFKWRAVTLINGNTEHRFGSSGRNSVKINLPREEWIIADWHSVPHFAGRPPLGIGRGDISSAIVHEAEGGPEACVLLQTVRNGVIPEAPADPDSSERIKRLQRGGYWVRADRDYLVIRDDSEFDADSKSSFVLDALAQSPKGFWFPTEAHRPGHQYGAQEIAPTFYSYHLKFDQNAPAEMFEPEFYND